MRFATERNAMSLVVALLLSALTCAPAGAAGSRPLLATEGQLATEARALRVLASAPVRREIGELEALYRADPQGTTPAGKATIRRAVDAIAMAAVNYAVNDDPGRPVVYWTASAPRRWFGLDVPRSGYGIDNPDNVYRNFRVEGASRYEIRGRVKRPGPVEQHFVVMGSIPGTTPMNVEGAQVVGALRSDAMTIAPDGSFTVTVDRDPANGRPNHLQIPARGTSFVIVRDLFTDWATQNPVALEVRRLAGPPLALAASEAQLAERAATLLAQIGPYWVEYDNRFVFSKPVNTVSAPRNRPGGRGFSSSGHFRLAPDEALIVTLDPLGAASLGFQLTDPWGVALEYIERTSSLNDAQVQQNPDGTITYVIAAQDPGVHNWLDPDGLASGIFAIRWQSLPVGATGERAVRDARVVKTAQMKDALPEGTEFVTTAERRAQQAGRARSYARRLE